MNNINFSKGSSRTKRTKGAKNHSYNRWLSQNWFKIAPLVGFQSRIACGFEPQAGQRGKTHAT